jgi:hypothetical protein
MREVMRQNCFALGWSAFHNMFACNEGIEDVEGFVWRIAGKSSASSMYDIVGLPLPLYILYSFTGRHLRRRWET